MIKLIESYRLYSTLMQNTISAVELDALCNSEPSVYNSALYEIFNDIDTSDALLFYKPSHKIIFESKYAYKTYLSCFHKYADIIKSKYINADDYIKELVDSDYFVESIFDEQCNESFNYFFNTSSTYYSETVVKCLQDEKFISNVVCKINPYITNAILTDHPYNSFFGYNTTFPYQGANRYPKYILYDTIANSNKFELIYDTSNEGTTGTNRADENYSNALGENFDKTITFIKITNYTKPSTTGYVTVSINDTIVTTLGSSNSTASFSATYPYNFKNGLVINTYTYCYAPITSIAAAGCFKYCVQAFRYIGD